MNWRILVAAVAGMLMAYSPGAVAGPGGSVPTAAEARSQDELAREFERRYLAWRKHLQELPPSVSSEGDYRRFYENQEFEAIVELGVPAVPVIVAKFRQDQMLGSVLHRITKWMWNDTRVGPGPGQWVWIVDEFPDMKSTRGPLPYRELWLRWWREGRQRTPQWFSERCAQWRALSRQGKTEEAKEKYQRMLEVGVGALPYIVERIGKGETDLIPAMSALTDGRVKQDATPNECIEWWNAHKQDWLIPWPEPSQTDQ